MEIGDENLAFLILFVTLGRLYGRMIKRPEARALLVFSGLVLIVGVLFYMHVEHWSFINAVYFCVVTLGTVGYGDIIPTTDVGKLFTVMYIIIGLSILGGFFATAGQLIDLQRWSSLRPVPPDLTEEIEALAKEREQLASPFHREEASNSE